MAIGQWIVDKSAVARLTQPGAEDLLAELPGPLYLCQVGELEQLYSARSSHDYDDLKSHMHASFEIVKSPADILDRALTLQRDLAHHHGMWHRIPIPDLLIAETALHHEMGVVHVDADFDRIAEVRALMVRRLRVK